MAILMTRSAQRSTSPTTRYALAQVEATTWMVGLPGTDVDAVRRAVAAALAPGSRWAKVRSLGDGRYRQVAPVMASLWADEIVRTADPVDEDPARAHELGATPLDRLPFAVVVTPDAIVLRWHRELGGHRDADLLLQRLVRAATAERTSAVAAG